MTEAKLLGLLVTRTTVWLGLMGALLFLAAGDWTWPQGWAFIAIFVSGSIGFSLWLMRRDPALLASRLTLNQKGTAVWDKVFLGVFILIWFVWLAVMALDARRWQLSHMPAVLNVLGAVLVIAGFLATTFVFRANSFAAPVVRVQEERGQRVIDTGPYAVVRHPMYACAMLYLVGCRCCWARGTGCCSCRSSSPAWRRAPSRRSACSRATCPAMRIT